MVIVTQEHHRLADVNRYKIIVFLRVFGYGFLSGRNPCKLLYINLDYVPGSRLHGHNRSSSGFGGTAKQSMEYPSFLNPIIFFVTGLYLGEPSFSTNNSAPFVNVTLSASKTLTVS